MPARTRPLYYIAGYGTPALAYDTLFRQEAQQLGIADRFFAVGAMDHNIAANDGRPAQARYGAVDLGLTNGMVRDAGGFLGDPRVAASRRPAWIGNVLSNNDKLSAAQRAHNVDVSFGINTYSEFGGNTLLAVEGLKDRHARHRGEIRLGVAIISHEPYLQEHLKEEPYLPVLFKEQGFLEATVEVYNGSDLALRYGRPFQNQLVTKGLIGLLAAVHHFPNQKTAPDITHALGRYGARVGMGFGLAHLTPLSPETGLRSLWHSFNVNGAAVIHIDDIVPQVLTAISQSLTDPAWRTMADDPNPTQQAAVVLHLPLKRRSLEESRVLRGVVATVEHHLSNAYPFVIPLWVLGHGAPMPGLEALSPLWVQASALWVLPDMPQTVEQIIGGSLGVTEDDGRQAVASDINAGLFLKPPAGAPDLRPVVTSFIPS